MPLAVRLMVQKIFKVISIEYGYIEMQQIYPNIRLAYDKVRAFVIIVNSNGTFSDQFL